MGREESVVRTLATAGRLENSSPMGRLSGAGMAMTIGALGIAVVDVALVVLSVTGEARVVVGALIVVDCPRELSGRRRDTTRRVVVVVGAVVVEVVVVVDAVVSSNNANGDSVLLLLSM